jgi:hypothetical protein
VTTGYFVDAGDQAPNNIGAVHEGNQNNPLIPNHSLPHRHEHGLNFNLGGTGVIEGVPAGYVPAAKPPSASSSSTAAPARFWADAVTFSQPRRRRRLLSQAEIIGTATTLVGRAADRNGERRQHRLLRR